jgi:ABC-type transport system involved in multi-copper enzyme maturation permease subunit
MSKVLAIARFTLLEATRTRMLWLALAAVGLLLFASLFVQELAITESTRVRAGFLAATLRFALVFVLSLHVASSMVREFNDKGIDLLLSLDLPRWGYYAGKLAGFVGIAWLLAAFATAALATTGLSPGLFTWGVSLGLELTLIATLTLFCVISFASIMPALSIVAAFYLLARSIAAIRLVAGSQILDHRSWTMAVARRLVDALALALPDLSRFTATDWLVAAVPAGALAFVLIQALVYGALLVLAGLFDLHRRTL